MISIAELRNITKGLIRLNEEVAQYSSFGIGGPVDYYIEPVDIHDFASLATFLNERGVPFLVCSSKNNLLVSAEGFHGALVNIEKGCSSIKRTDECVYADAGARIAKVIDFCVANSLSGLEQFAGISGAVGEMISIDCTANDQRISDVLENIEVLMGGDVLTLPKNADKSFIPESRSRGIVLGGKFALKQADKNELLARRRAFLISNNRRSPVNLNSAGTIFRDPPSRSAATLISESGFMKKVEGGARVLDSNANVIINTGDASAEDILSLVKLMHKSVMDTFNIGLETDVRFVGFQQDILVGAS